MYLLTKSRGHTRQQDRFTRRADAERAFREAEKSALKLGWDYLDWHRADELPWRAEFVLGAATAMLTLEEE